LFEAYLWDGMQMKIARVSFVYCRSTTNCKWLLFNYSEFCYSPNSI